MTVRLATIGVAWCALLCAAPISADVKSGGAKADHAASAESHEDPAHHAQTLRGDRQPENPIGFDPILFGFTLVLFLVLLFVMNKVAWQPLLESLAEREKRIADIVNEAENTRAEAQMLIAKSDKELAASHEEVRRMLDKVRAEATQESEAMLARAKDEAVAERAKAVAEIDAAKRTALAEVGERSAALAAKMVGKFAGRPIDAGAVGKHMEN